MRTWITLGAALVALGGVATFALAGGKQADPLIVHEWGTFTSVQGSDGASLEGLQHEEEPLPSFVYSRAKIRDCPLRAVGYKGLEVPATHVTQKMETPVIYFHTKTPRRVRVRVDFMKGLLTQWYPVSDLLGPPDNEKGKGPLDLSKVESSFLQWDVELIPHSEKADLHHPTVSPDEPWSFAREVDCADVRTVPRQSPRRGPTESERYIFYRGLGTFTLPVRVTAKEKGSIVFHNDSNHDIPAAFALWIDGDQGAFTLLDAVTARSQRSVAKTPLFAKKDVVEKLGQCVQRALIAQGLNDDEARAMVRTWSRQWFASQGSRVIYLVPRALTDSLLPLQISPAPDQLVRVLVGRVEYLTPEVEDTVKQALRDRKSSNPEKQAIAEKTLESLGRFLEPHVRAVASRSDDEQVISSAGELLSTLK